MSLVGGGWHARAIAPPFVFAWVPLALNAHAAQILQAYEPVSRARHQGFRSEKSRCRERPYVQTYASYLSYSMRVPDQILRDRRLPGKAIGLVKTRKTGPSVRGKPHPGPETVTPK
jgi:hypothetical protein